jgi:Family of unknown function (DUF6152)
MLKSIPALSVLLALAVTPAYAHHSFAGFDMEKTQVISGTLVRIDFSAPHARLVMMDGDAQEYQFLTGSPTQLLQHGFDPRTAHKGDKIEVTFHPTRNGSRGGQLVKMKMPDGRELISPLEPGGTDGTPVKPGGEATLPLP